MSIRFLLPCRASFVAGLLALLSFFAAPSSSADPAARVGRIAWLSGAVHLHRADSGESSSALLNWPLTSGDLLSTAAGARSEVQFGSSTLRLAAGSIVEFVAVDDDRLHLRLVDGSVMVHLRTPVAAAEFELSTRDGRFTAREAGVYRFDLERTASVATVDGGGLRFVASDRAVDVAAGQRVQIWNDGRTRYYVTAPVDDDLARWSAAREQAVGAATYARYVSPEMTGAADLDAHGEWTESSEHGAVWLPRAVAADWAPYRHGRWVWIAPWGWTWVGEEPWGFAPFHYGRWVIHRGAWGWVPGHRVARPVYAPALVAWVGSPGVSVAVGVGRPAVGWFPLAPREVYVPPYRASARYVRQVNETHVTQINNITTITGNPQAAVEQNRYVHRRSPQAVTMVPAETIAERRRVAPAQIPPHDRAPADSQPVQVQGPQPAPPAARGDGRPAAAGDARERRGDPGARATRDPAGEQRLDAPTPGGGRESPRQAAQGPGPRAFGAAASTPSATPAPATVPAAAAAPTPSPSTPIAATPPPPATAAPSFAPSPAPSPAPIAATPATPGTPAAATVAATPAAPGQPATAATPVTPVTPVTPAAASPAAGAAAAAGLPSGQPSAAAAPSPGGAQTGRSAAPGLPQPPAPPAASGQGARVPGPAAAPPAAVTPPSRPLPLDVPPAAPARAMPSPSPAMPPASSPPPSAPASAGPPAGFERPVSPAAQPAQPARGASAGGVDLRQQPPPALPPPAVVRLPAPERPGIDAGRPATALPAELPAHRVPRPDPRVDQAPATMPQSRGPSSVGEPPVQRERQPRSERPRNEGGERRQQLPGADG